MLTENNVNSIILDLNNSQNQKILNRNGKDWYDEFCASFVIDELLIMRDYVLSHTPGLDYNIDDYNDISDLVYNYMMYLVFDLINAGETGSAKLVMNAGYI